MLSSIAFGSAPGLNLTVQNRQDDKAHRSPQAPAKTFRRTFFFPTLQLDFVQGASLQVTSNFCLTVAEPFCKFVPCRGLRCIPDPDGKDVQSPVAALPQAGVRWKPACRQAGHIAPQSSFVVEQN